MDPEFWRECWQERQLGFNQAKPNALLIEHWRRLGVAQSARVFVPLCGKSVDMHWLREQGHHVLGVELSAIAVREFFEEGALEPRRAKKGCFEAWEAQGFRVLQGDFFDLRTEDLEGVEAVYDRAALVAFPPEMRRSYVREFSDKLPASISILLIAMEARPHTGNGPPFSVMESEVRELYEPGFDVEMLDRSPFVETKTRDGATVARSNVAYLIRR